MGAPDAGPWCNHLFIEDVDEEPPPQVVLLDTDPDITLGLDGLYVAVPEGHVAHEILHAEPGVEPSQDEPEASQHELNALEGIPREDVDASLEVHAPSVTQRKVTAYVAQAQVEIPKDGLLTSPHGIQHDETPQEDAHVTGVCTPCQEDIQESGEVVEVTPIQESVSETKSEGDTTSIHQESGGTGTHPESQMEMVQESTPNANPCTLAKKADKGYEQGADTRPLQGSTHRDEPVGGQPRGSQESDYTENRYGVQRHVFEVSDAKSEGRAHDDTTSKEKEGVQVHREPTTGSVRRVELPTPVVKVPQKDEKPEERAHDQMTSKEKEEKEEEGVHMESVREVEHLTPVKKVPQKPKEEDESPQTKEPKTEAVQESNEAVHHVQGQAVQESEGLSPAEVGNSDTNTHWQSTDL